jgi:hypothetical protein
MRIGTGKVNWEKCELKKKVTYLGQRTNAEVIHPIKEWIQPITDASALSNVTKLILSRNTKFLMQIPT